MTIGLTCRSMRRLVESRGPNNHHTTAKVETFACSVIPESLQRSFHSRALFLESLRRHFFLLQLFSKKRPLASCGLKSAHVHSQRGNQTTTKKSYHRPILHPATTPFHRAGFPILRLGCDFRRTSPAARGKFLAYILNEGT